MENRLLFLALGALVSGGCTAGDAAPPYQIRDSAGVQIVESYGPLWREGGLPGEGENWRIGPDPILRIGVVEGDAAYQFDGVTGGARLEDGTLVVADYGYQDVRYFDAEGHHILTFGGPGEGPGEFQGLASLGLDPEGRIWAYDFLLRRVTWLGPRGEMTGSTRLGPEPPMLQPLGPLPDGSFLLKQLWGATEVAEATETGLRRDDIAFVRFDSVGLLLDTLGLFPGREVFLTEEDGRGVMSTPPFPRNTLGVVWNGAVMTGSNETFELREHTTNGELVRILRLPGLDLSLQPGDREEYIRNRLEAAAEERRPGLRNELESMPFPDARPAFGGLLPDEDGNLWVGDWALTPQVAEGWTVLDPQGRWLGEVEVPHRFSPLQVGTDWILGVQWDDMDIEYVVLYPLRKGAGDGA